MQASKTLSRSIEYILKYTYPGSSLVVQWVEDQALSLLWHRFLLWHSLIAGPGKHTHTHTHTHTQSHHNRMKYLINCCWGLYKDSDKDETIKVGSTPVRVEQCCPQIHVHPESQNVTLFENIIFADVISSDEVPLDRVRLESNGSFSHQRPM